MKHARQGHVGVAAQALGARTNEKAKLKTARTAPPYQPGFLNRKANWSVRPRMAGAKTG